MTVDTKGEMPAATANLEIDPVSAQTADPNTGEPGLARILGILVPVSAVLAERLLPVEAILQIRPGTILEFDVPFGSDLSIRIGDHMLGHGQAVKVGEHFGLRVTAIETVRQRIEAMGKP